MFIHGCVCDTRSTHTHTQYMYMCAFLTSKQQTFPLMAFSILHTHTHTHTQERLPKLLHSVISTSCHIRQPSAFVEFLYKPPTKPMHTDQMLTVPYVMSWEAKPRCISMWLCVNKYPLQAWLHLFSAFTGDVFLQVWACACSGDVIIR